MKPIPQTEDSFRFGDAVVVLYNGLHNGLPGRYLGRRQDSAWADIEEIDGTVRGHPVAWLRRPEDLAIQVSPLEAELLQ